MYTQPRSVDVGHRTVKLHRRNCRERGGGCVASSSNWLSITKEGSLWKVGIDGRDGGEGSEGIDGIDGRVENE